MDSFSGPFTFVNKENATISGKQESSAKENAIKPSSIFKSNNTNNNNNHNENVLTAKKVSIMGDNLRTPTNIKTRHHDVQPKRVPLGGKDKNLIFNNNHGANNKSSLNDFGSLSTLGSTVKKRSWRLRTPKKKLNILKDDDSDDNANDVIYNDKVNVFNDNEIKIDYDFDDEIEYVPEKEAELPDKPLNYEPFTDDELLNISKLGQSIRLEDLTDVPSNKDIDVNEEYPLDFDYSDEQDDVKSTISKDINFHFMEPTFVSNAKKISRENSITEGLSTADLYRLIEEQ